jgi:hypothetical protein
MSPSHSGILWARSARSCAITGWIIGAIRIAGGTIHRLVLHGAIPIGAWTVHISVSLIHEPMAAAILCARLCPIDHGGRVCGGCDRSSRNKAHGEQPDKSSESQCFHVHFFHLCPRF